MHLCFIATINGICNNFYNAVDNIVEYKASQLVNEYIDNGVLSASALSMIKSLLVLDTVMTVVSHLLRQMPLK